MRFFHLSDLHIGLKLINHDLSEDQEYILNQIVGLAGRYHPDAVVIAGDIYDKAVPSAEAVELFDHFISELTEVIPDAEIMLISGNHDSGPRINCLRSVLSRQKVHMIGLPPQSDTAFIERVVMRDEAGEIHFYLLPFVKPSMVKQIVGTDANGNHLSYEDTICRLIGREKINPGVRNVLVSHQFYLPAGSDAGAVERMDSEIRTAGNIDAVSSDVLRPFDYAALGHIHKPMKAGNDRFRYCGTPLACSVSESGQKKGVILVDLPGKGSLKTEVLPLFPLREVKKVRGSLQEVLDMACEDYVSVTLTDRTEQDAADLQDRIRNAFPNLLELRRESVRTADYRAEMSRQKQMDPFALCCEFLRETDAAEEELLRDVINTVQTRA